MKSFFSEAFRSTRKILACCLLVLLTGTCHKKTTNPETKPAADEDNVIPISDSTFILRNLGVNFESWDPATNRAGDFLFKTVRNTMYTTGPLSRFLETGRCRDSAGPSSATCTSLSRPTRRACLPNTIRPVHTAACFRSPKFGKKDGFSSISRV